MLNIIFPFKFYIWIMNHLVFFSLVIIEPEGGTGHPFFRFFYVSEHRKIFDADGFFRDNVVSLTFFCSQIKYNERKPGGKPAA